eukprot:5490730-Amphidinium_carterae.1
MTAWEGKQVTQFLEGLSLLKQLDIPGNWPLRQRATSRQCSSSRSQDKPRKDMAGWAWHLSRAAMRNFSQQDQQGSLVHRVLARQGNRQAADSQVHRLEAPTANKAGQQPTKSGTNATNTVLTEQILRRQIKLHHQRGKGRSYTYRALGKCSAEDQRHQTTEPFSEGPEEQTYGKSQLLSTKIDKRTKVIEDAMARRVALKEELITTCIRLEHLPPEPLPAPKALCTPASTLSSALDALLELAKKRTTGESTGGTHSGRTSEYPSGSVRTTGTRRTTLDTQARSTGHRRSASGDQSRERPQPTGSHCSSVNRDNGAYRRRAHARCQRRANGGHPAGEEDSEERARFKEQRKKMHARLEAGEDLLAFADDQDIQQPLLRPAAKAKATGS